MLLIVCLTKLGMWCCRRNKSDICGIDVRNCKYFCLVAALQQHLTMESIYIVRYNTLAVMLFLFVGNVWVRHIQQIVAIFTEVLWSAEAPLVSGLKEWRIPKQEKQSATFASLRPSCAAGSPEMLQHADTIVCEEGHITNWQLVHCLLIGKGGIIHSIRYLGYSKVCSKWVLRG